MKRHVHSLIGLAILLYLGPSLYGQSIIKGQLTNKLRQPLTQASVVLFQVQDSSFVSFTVTRQDGSFSIPKVKPGLYYLQFTASGYSPSKSDPIRIIPERTLVPIGVKVLHRKKPKPLAVKPARV